MTLPANSTFLPVLDDLLSPDFRPLNLPAQTPQTPTDVVSFGGGKIITNAYGNITGYNSVGSRPLTFGRSGATGSMTAVHEVTTSTAEEKIQTSDSEVAASKIQNWWKSRRSVSIDLGAERAKHSIRHNRTEDHIRFLEAEVSRLKATLSSERKIRSLQVEAIRSLWSQLQRISSSDGTNASLMTRSVPNGLLRDTDVTNHDTVMSMSLNTALGAHPVDSSQKQCDHEASAASCSCSKEVQRLREVFTEEISQLRGMIDQLTSKSASCNTSGNSADLLSTSHGEDVEMGTNNGLENRPALADKLQQQKRPLSLNLVGIANSDHENSRNSPDSHEKTADEEKIVDYASQMASKLVDDAVEDKENNSNE